jgi:DnaJ-domain-containing protein 1
VAKRGFLDGYDTYDAKTEGYGHPRQWRATFRHRMGLDEARRVMGAESPQAVLGLGAWFTQHELKQAYRVAAMGCHPDRAVELGRSVAELTEAFKRVTAAYTILNARFERSER